MKKILVLGGSYLQSFFIETAVEIGEEVYVLDQNNNCYARSIDDIVFSQIDIADENKVEKFFLEKTCDLIVSPVTEIGNRTAASIANRHGLYYNSIGAVKATTDKREMRNRLKNCALKEIKSEGFRSIEHIKKNFDYPLMIKPAVSSASRGVSLVDNEKELQPALNKALKFCRNKSYILVEEYIKGNQYSIETISSHGEHYIVGITREYISAPPCLLERTDVMMIDETKKLYNKLHEYIDQLLNKFEIETGPCHIEVRLRDDEIYLIEVASRSGLLRDRLMNAANCSNYNELILKAYSGEKINITDIKEPENCSLLGIIMTPQDLKTYLEVKVRGLLVDEYFTGKGPELEPESLTDAFGYFIIAGDKGILDYRLV